MTMNYEKKYKEALQRAIEAKQNTESAVTIKILEDIFSELKNEDERIRNRLIAMCQHYIECYSLDPYNADDYKEALAWLEKQGKILRQRADVIIANMLDDKIDGIQRELIEFAANAIEAPWLEIIKSADYYAQRIRNIIDEQDEQKSAMIQWKGDNLKDVIDFTGKAPQFEKWFKTFDEYEQYVHEHNNIFKLFYEDGSHYEVPVGAWIVRTPDGYNVASKAVYKQKPTWSEEDERMIGYIINEIENVKQQVHCKTFFDEEIAWLESLKDRVQPKVELTQLDKNILEAAIAFVEQNNHFNYWGGVDKHTVLSALHSLKPYNTWKPSDEQMQNPAWSREDEQNLNAALGYIDDEYLRRWLKDVIHTKYDKPAWMNCDAHTLQGIIDEIEANKSEAKSYEAETYDRYLTFLKSIQDRMKGE